MKKIIYTLTFILTSLKALAHPHIWVYTDLDLKTNDDKITGIDVVWKFDEMYSSAFMMDADKNGDKRLSYKESKAMEKQVMDKAVTMLTPFVMLKFNNKDTYGYNFENLDITYNKKTEQVEYRFSIVLKQPINLKGFHKLAIFDQEFYVAFEQSYDFKIPKNCHFDLIEDEQITVYEGMIHPEVYQLTCK